MADNRNKLATVANNLKAKGHSAPEIAELMGISRQYVYELLQRHEPNDGSSIVLAAVDSLRDELKETTDKLIEELTNVKAKIENQQTQTGKEPFTQSDLEKALHHYLARVHGIGKGDRDDE